MNFLIWNDYQLFNYPFFPAAASIETVGLMNQRVQDRLAALIAEFRAMPE